MLHDSLRMTDLDVIEVVTIGVFPTNCDILCSLYVNMVSRDRWVPHSSIGARDEAASSWLTIKASGVTRTRLP